MHLQTILERGYFPKELPPPFTTETFAQAQAALHVATVRDSLPLRYSYSKYASVRRTVSIPNPAHFLPLAQAVASNWVPIVDHCRRSTISRTKPTPDLVRAITGEHGLESIPAVRAEIRTGARYVLKADVANFYGSVYTHAIPWAFHTKSVAKADRDPRKSRSGGPPMFGNVLDEASRNIQSGQTIGLPIGPDTSFAIAEALLSTVDAMLWTKLTEPLPAFRFVDDYEFACGSLSEAESVRSHLQDALGHFELQLNSRKTRILELPHELDTPWAHELATFDIESDRPGVQKSQILRYFSRAFELTRNNPGEPILKYAMRRLVETKTPHNEHLVQQLALQSATIDPGTLHLALYLVNEHKKGYEGTLDEALLLRALSTIIEQHSALQHGGDVAWAL